jgi:hypothetical protein
VVGAVEAALVQEVEGGKDVAANIPGAEMHIIPNMGHDLPILLVETIADHLTRVASRPGSAG